MTNADKYNLTREQVKQLVMEFVNFCTKNEEELYNEQYNEGGKLEAFLKAPIQPTLTEDERVILRNLRYEKGAYEYTKIGRTDLDSEGNCDLILIDSDDESVWWGEYGHLFQFIKERRRIFY